MTTDQDAYAPQSETTEGRVFTVTGQDWDSITQGLSEEHDNKVVVNMGPQHPSTHGVLRLILELEGETVTEARCGTSSNLGGERVPEPRGAFAYLHPGIKKNVKYRSWCRASPSARGWTT